MIRSEYHADLEARFRRLRKTIDELDEAMASLLVIRASASRQAQELKGSDCQSVIDYPRENEIQERYEAKLFGGASVARAILRCCRRED